MRLAFMTFACPAWTWAEAVGAAVRHGYAGIEPRIDAGQAHGIEVAMPPSARAEARRRAEDAGLAICCLATSLQYIKLGEPAVRDLLEQTEARCALAAELGIPGLRVFGGALPEGVGLATGLAAAGENLRAAGEIAAAHGIELWVETHDTLSRGADCAAVVTAADHPAVGVNWDVMHPFRNGEPLAATMSVLEGRIRHCHWHDAVAATGAPVITRFGAGELPLAEMHAALAAAGYAGYLSGEWFGEQLGATPDEALAHYAARAVP